MLTSRLAVFLFFATFASAGYASCPIKNIEHFSEMVAAEYKKGTLEKIDKKYSSKEPFEVVIENSLREGDPFERTNVISFKEAAGWLKKRQVEGSPSPGIRKLVSCENGVCLFDFFEGIHHNTLYLSEIRYKGTSNCRQLEAIQFLDGN